MKNLSVAATAASGLAASLLIFQNCAPNFQTAQNVRAQLIQSSISTAALVTKSNTPISSADKSPVISWALADNQSFPIEPNQFTCALDGVTVSNCQSPLQLDIPNDGHHFFTVQAMSDQIVVATGSYDFYVDTQPPEVVINSFPEDVAGSTNLITSFSAIDAVSGVDHVICAVDDSPVSCSSPYESAELSEGPHSFVITAVDKVGNASTPVARNWVVSSSAPSINVSNVPSFTGADVTVNFAASSKAGLKVTSTCALDGQSAVPCADAITFTSLSEGRHALAIRSTDEVQKFSTAQINWTVDLTPPVVNLLNQSHLVTSVSPYTVQFSATDAGSGSPQCECAIASNPFTPCKTGVSIAYTQDGPQSVDVRCRDLVGNVSAVQRVQWIWDKTPPALTITTSVPSLTSSISAVFSVSATDAVTSSPRIDVSLNGQPFEILNSPTYTASVTDGMQTVAFRATDAAGNSSTRSFNWTVDTRPPSDPTEIELVATSQTHFNASWISTDDTGVDHYEVRVGSQPMGEDVLKTTTVVTGSYSFSDVQTTLGATIFVGVRAFDKIGHSSNWAVSAPFRLLSIAGKISCLSGCQSGFLLDTSKATLLSGQFKTSLPLIASASTILDVVDANNGQNPFTLQANTTHDALVAICSVGSFIWNCDPSRIVLPDNVPSKTLTTMNVNIRYGSKPYTTISQPFVFLPAINAAPEPYLAVSSSMEFFRNANVSGSASGYPTLISNLYITPNVNVIMKAGVGSICAHCNPNIVVGDGATLKVQSVALPAPNAVVSPANVSVGRGAVFVADVALFETLQVAEGAIVILGSPQPALRVVDLTGGIPVDPCASAVAGTCPSSTTAVR